MTMLALRPYQSEAVDALWSALHEREWKPGTGPGLVLPTGGGKTVVFAHLVQRWLAEHGGRALILAHRGELVRQARDRLTDVAPGLRAGVVQADQNQAGADVVCASTQTLASENRRRMIRDVSLVVADEAHHYVAPSYRAVLDHYGALGSAQVGVTATMVRGDEGRLGEVWPDVVYSRSISDMIAGGFLVRPRGVRVVVRDLELDQVKTSGGDYQAGALGEALADSLAPQAVARAYVEHGKDRQGILFAPTVDAADQFQKALADQGISSALVHGAMPHAERLAELQRFRDGGVQVLANCMVLTEGTDLPPVSCIVVARPTKSIGLFVQMVGRGLRLFPGKGDCLVLDVTGVTRKHKLTPPIQLFADEVGGMEVATEVAELGELGEFSLTEEMGSDGTPGPEVFGGADGELVYEEVDLFGQSALSWQRTRGGTWFLAAGDRYIAIVRGSAGSGSYSVVWMDAKRHGSSGWVAQDLHQMSAAMAWGEQEVTPAEQTTAARNRRWRKDPISPRQRDWCMRSGVAWEGLSKGEVSELMSVTFASRRIDATVQQAYGGAA